MAGLGRISAQSQKAGGGMSKRTLTIELYKLSANCLAICPIYKGCLLSKRLQTTRNKDTQRLGWAALPRVRKV